ncbi:MAG: hypothetical protein ACREVE_14260 [Gammaproteobacteria bacterium]
MKQKMIASLASVALAIAAVTLVWQLFALYRAESANATIARLLDGYDVSVDDDAPAEVLLARTHFLMRRDRFDEASELFAAIERRNDTGYRSQLLYNMANARLRSAIELVEGRDYDRSVAMVQLAKDLYREALKEKPGLWDAKYNLDVAMRLVRDLPQVSSGGDEDEELSKKLWTQMPGFPRGLP